MRTRLFTVAVLCFAVLASGRVSAEEWVAKMFGEQSHDFGAVASGADAVYKFAIKNIYKQDIELVRVSSSCGCTSPSIEKKTLKTGEVGYLTAKFNTRTFTGVHGATLTVTVAWNDKGRRRTGEAQVRVNGNIRGDVVFKPGAIRFDNVDQGLVNEQVVEVSYAGRSDWKIVDVRGVSDDLEVELTPKRRSGGRIEYNLLVRLKPTAPAGYFNDQLVIVTNDGVSTRMPMHISGRVVPQIEVAESVALGDVAQGSSITKNVIVRGKQPFRIVSIECDDKDCFRFEADDKSSKTHVVKVIFDAKHAPGQVNEAVRIATDLGANFNATMNMFVNVVPGAAEPAPVQPLTLEGVQPLGIEAGTAGTNSQAATPVAQQ